VTSRAGAATRDGERHRSVGAALGDRPFGHAATQAPARGYRLCEQDRRMSRPLRKTARAALLAALSLAILPARALAEPVAPLPESEYSVRSACGAPLPGHGSCFAEELVPRTRLARQRRHPIGMVRNLSPARGARPSLDSGVYGLRPEDIHSAYELPETAPGTQTIAIVDAYNDPTAEADLRTYSEEFGLPLCTSENGCFRKVGETGSSAAAGLPFPKSTTELETFLGGSKEEKEEADEAIGWGVEISLDIESAHATCENCKILLVEAGELSGRKLRGPTSFSHLAAAESRAETIGAQEISNSWGGPETGITPSEDSASPFDHPGTVITASAGDDGYRNWQERPLFTSYPASSPHVVAVGGTRLLLNGEGRRSSERVWNGDGASGGGCSTQFPAPEWQLAAANWAYVGCSKRLDNDVAADADPYTGVVIRDTDLSGKSCEAEYENESTGQIESEQGWCTYGGTSLASPLVAATFALAGGANGISYPARTLYENQRYAPYSFYDVSAGSNGECAAGYNANTGLSDCSASEEAAASCSSHLSCLAAIGYDGPSGVGAPDGVDGFIPGPEAFAEEEEGEEEPQPTPPAVRSTPPPPRVPAPAPLVIAPTTPAVIALDRKPAVAKVAFHFNSNLPARVTVTLTRKVRVHHHVRWVAVGRPRKISAIAGRNLSRLTGSLRLRAGTYRLTLAPSGGRARSMVFNIG
jgi:hypothetical protein